MITSSPILWLTAVDVDDIDSYDLLEYWIQMHFLRFQIKHSRRETWHNKITSGSYAKADTNSLIIDILLSDNRYTQEVEKTDFEKLLKKKLKTAYSALQAKIPSSDEAKAAFYFAFDKFIRSKGTFVVPTLKECVAKHRCAKWKLRTWIYGFIRQRTNNFPCKRRHLF